MKRNLNIILMVILGAMLALGGCLQTQIQSPGQTQPPAGKGTTQKTCGEYCPTLPHIECVGKWNISGVYPDCICAFECEKQQETGGTVQPNATAQNGGTANQQPPAEISPYATLPPRQETDIIDGAIQGIKSAFYNVHSGTFSENCVSWAAQAESGPGPQEIGLTAPNVLFEGKSIDGLRASTFCVFKNSEDKSSTIYGMAVFRSKTTKLDEQSYLFDVSYPPVFSPDLLRDCSVFARDYNLNENRNLTITYSFTCVSATSQ